MGSSTSKRLNRIQAKTADADSSKRGNDKDDVLLVLDHEDDEEGECYSATHPDDDKAAISSTRHELHSTPPSNINADGSTQARKGSLSFGRTTSDPVGISSSAMSKSRSLWGGSRRSTIAFGTGAVTDSEQEPSSFSSSNSYPEGLAPREAPTLIFSSFSSSSTSPADMQVVDLASMSAMLPGFQSTTSVLAGFNPPTYDDLVHDFQFLLDGVDGGPHSSSRLHGIIDPSNPTLATGRLSVMLPQAFPFLLDSEGIPVAAAARYGGGRVCLLAHSDFIVRLGDLVDLSVKQAEACDESLRYHQGHDLDRSTDGQESGNLRLLQNIIAWLCPEDDGSACSALCNMTGAATPLEEILGCNVPTEWSLKRDSIRDHDIVVVRGSDIEYGNISDLHDYVVSGGSLLIADSGSRWELRSGGIALRDHPCNMLISVFGMCIISGEAVSEDLPLPNESQVPKSKGYLVQSIDMCNIDVTSVLEQVNKISSGGKIENTDFRFRPIFQILLDAISSLPNPCLVALSSMVKCDKDIPVPSVQHPITGDMHQARAIVLLRKFKDRIGDESLSYVAEDAQYFPGMIENSSGEENFTHSVQVSLDKDNWQTTGLYAPPGQIISVKIVSETREAINSLNLQIGCHTDVSWNKAPSSNDQNDWRKIVGGSHALRDAWYRWPELCHTFNISPNPTVSSGWNPRGGPIFIVRDPSAKHSNNSVKLEITGAVRASVFKLGDNIGQDWKIESSKGSKDFAPWTELIGRWITFHVPFSFASEISDVGAVISFWDDVVECYNDLIRPPSHCPPQQRVVFDIQPSEGHGHGGNPIVLHMDHMPHVFADETKLRKNGYWPLFHYLGSNFKDPCWNFQGFEFAASNLFALYASHVLLKKETDRAHKSLKNYRLKALKFIMTSGGERPNDPSIALAMFALLQQEFSWSKFRQVFLQYGRVHGLDRPMSDGARVDMFITKFCNVVHQDMTPFFDLFGLRVTDIGGIGMRQMGFAKWHPSSNVCKETNYLDNNDLSDLMQSEIREFQQRKRERMNKLRIRRNWKRVAGKTNVLSALTGITKSRSLLESESPTINNNEDSSDEEAPFMVRMNSIAPATEDSKV
eukprot:UC4_evm4s1249